MDADHRVFFFPSFLKRRVPHLVSFVSLDSDSGGSAPSVSIRAPRFRILSLAVFQLGMGSDNPLRAGR